jgi:hypothetical protein
LEDRFLKRVMAGCLDKGDEEEYGSHANREEMKVRKVDGGES